MKPAIWILIIVVILILAFAFSIYLLLHVIKNTDTIKQIVTADKLPTVYYIDIRDYGFFPQNITIENGYEIIWNNFGVNNHSVTFEGINLSSGIILPKRNYSVVFNYSGVFNYSCAFHPDMKGQIIVKNNVKD